MKRRLVVMVGFLVLVSIAYWVYLQNTRYSIRSIGRGVAYKIDRKTGQTWLLRGASETLIMEQDQASDSGRVAINLVKETNFERNIGGEDQRIGQELQKKRGRLTLFGWKAEQVNKQVFLVSYIYDEGGGKVGYFYEVNLVSDIVRRIAADSELARMYKSQIGEVKCAFYLGTAID